MWFVAVLELPQAASTSTQAVSASWCMPALSLRTLARISSDTPDLASEERVKAERADIWKKAKASQQKYVQFAILKNRSLAGLTTVLR